MIVRFHQLKKSRTGSTLVSAIVYAKRYVVMANVGDSRAVLGSKSGQATRLTVDHKPQLPAERVIFSAKNQFNTILHKWVGRSAMALFRGRMINVKKLIYVPFRKTLLYLSAFTLFREAVSFTTSIITKDMSDYSSEWRRRAGSCRLWACGEWRVYWRRVVRSATPIWNVCDCSLPNLTCSN